MIKLDKEVFWKYCKDSKSAQMAKLLRMNFRQGVLLFKTSAEESFCREYRNFIPQNTEKAGEEINI